MTTTKFTRWTLLIASCAILSLASCKDNDDAYNRPSISVTQLTKDSEGKTLISPEESIAKLHIRSNRAWTATTALDWLSITPESGEAGEQEVTIKVLKNISGATRQGQFAFKAGSETIYYTITQAGDGSAVLTPGKEVPTPEHPTTPVTVDGAALTAFINKYDKGQSVVINEDASFKAILISDITAKNITSRKNIVVQAGEVGITLRLAANASEDWRPGAVFTVKAKGAKVGRYQNGSLQIDYTGVNDAASMVTPTGEVATITPKALTFADIYSGKYDNILVAVDGAQFKETGKELNPNKAVQGKKTPGSYFNTITDCATQAPEGLSELSVAISYYATFKTVLTSDKNGRIVGILQRSVTTNKSTGKSVMHYNLWPRTAEDLAGLNGERCTSAPSTDPAPKPAPVPEPAPVPAPTPTPPAPAPTGDLIISAYVEGFKNEKYIQISNPTSGDIDLSGYTLLIKNFGSKNQPVTGEFAESRIPLKGKIAAGGTLVLRHKDATIYKEAKVVDFAFNGNDPVSLLKGTEVIDHIGNGSAAVWLDKDKPAGADIVLHRKTAIDKPSAAFLPEQWDRIVLTKENESNTITLYLGKR